MKTTQAEMLNPDLEPGRAVQLSENIVRIVADNGSVMTGAGTNSYLLGQGELVLVDPGPKSEAHCQAILDAAKTRGEIKYIALTHTHSDHSPGVDAILESTSAKVALYPEPTGKPFHDIPVKADIPLRHNQVLTGFSPELLAVHTPGHASNHLCFYCPDEKVLFTGDHLMNGSTVVIASPDGNMTEYLDSLALLKSYDIDFLCPGHGAAMPDVYEVVDKTIAHRLGREQKVLKAMQKLERGKLDEVVLEAYADTPSFLHGLAKMSLTAHLEKLEREGKVLCENNTWINNS